MTVNDNLTKAGRIPSAFYPIRVASGLACRPDGTILMGKRKHGGLRPGLWELPGGKVEDLESPREALIREWKEELDLQLTDLDVGVLLDAVQLNTEVSFVVELYPVVIPRYQSPRALDHDELAWLEPTMAVMHYPCSPAFYIQYRSILTWSKA